MKFGDRFRRDRSPTDPVEVAVAEHQRRTGIKLEIRYKLLAGVWEAKDEHGAVWESSVRNRLFMALLEHLAQQPDREGAG